MNENPTESAIDVTHRDDAPRLGRSRTWAELAADETGSTSLEYVLVLGMFVLAMFPLLPYGLRVLGSYFGMMDGLIALPVP